jgi:predicted RNA methylase
VTPDQLREAERLVHSDTASPEVRAIATLLASAGRGIGWKQLTAAIAAVGTLGGGAGYFGAGQVAQAETERVAQEAVQHELKPIKDDVQWVKRSVKSIQLDRARDRRLLCKAAGVDPDSLQCPPVEPLPAEPVR